MIKLIKLTNGEELVSEVVEMDDTNIVLEKPMVVESVETEDGYNTVLQSYLKFDTNTSCTLNLRHVILVLSVPDEICEYYENSKYFSEQYDKAFIKKVRRANKEMSEYINLTKNDPKPILSDEENEKEDESNRVIDSFRYITRKLQ